MPDAETRQRRRAALRGLEFIYRVAREPESFADYGSDLLSCFYFVAQTSADANLRRRALAMGRERARRWRRDNPRLPARADAETVLDFIHGAYAADQFAAPDDSLKAQVRRAAARLTPRDFLCFDPREEPPPRDVPERCECGERNARGRRRCVGCRRALEAMSRYGVWYDALVRAYSAARYGVSLGATYEDVLRWLPALRPYPASDAGENPDFYDAVYAVTHVVYTLNDYSRYRLSPRWLPREFAFMKANLRVAIGREDPEMVGEFLDVLRAFGLGDSHALVRAGVSYLLATQKEDGSWGDHDEEETYARYHTTWTAVDGLREYRWRGVGLSFPEVKPLLLRCARDGAATARRARRNSARRSHTTRTAK